MRPWTRQLVQHVCNYIKCVSACVCTCVCVWADGSFVGDVRFHMGKHTLLRLDNYTGLGQGLVALKTNAHIHTEHCKSTLFSPTSSPPSFLRLQWATMEPLALKHTALSSFCWAKTQQQHVWHSIGQEFLYAHKHGGLSCFWQREVIWRGAAICLQRIFKGTGGPVCPASC